MFRLMAFAALLGTASPTAPLDGRWLVTMTEADGTQLTFRLTMEQRGDAWQAWSREGAVLEMVSWWKGLAGRILGKLPPHGAHVTIDNGRASRTADSASLTGSVVSFFGTYQLTGFVRGDTLRATIARNSGAQPGTVTGVRTATEQPLRNYAEIVSNAERVARDVIYNPALATSAPWREFFDGWRERMSHARDDLDAVTSFYALRPEIGFSHWNFIRNPKLARTTLESLVVGDSAVVPDSLVSLSFTVPGVAVLRVRKWDRVGSVIDRAFTRIDSAHVNTLVLDIRSNPGGDATSASVAAHLFADSVDVGTFLGPRWYRAHTRPPAAEEARGLPLMTSDQQGVDLIRTIRERGGVRAKVSPRQPFFGGSVYVLTDGATASASEPLAYILSQTHRATLIGERTAGAMLTALPHDLGDGWVIVAPEADFFAADGTRLEGRGVDPDVRASGVDALLALAGRVEATSPVAGSMLRGGALGAVRRWDESLTAYRHALELLAAEGGGRWEIVVRKRMANVLRAKGSIDDARRELETVLRLSPEDQEARTALRALP